MSETVPLFLTFARSSEHVRAGLVRCTTCGGVYIGGAGHGSSGERYRYYRCRKRALEAPAVCNAPHVRADLLEKAVVELLLRTYQDTELFERAVQESLAGKPATEAELKRSKRAVEAEIAKLEKATSRYLEAFEAGTLETAAFAQRVEELNVRRARLESERDELVQQLTMPDAEFSPEDFERVRQQLAQVLHGPVNPRTKALMQLVVERIDLAPDRTAMPVLRVPTRSAGDQEGSSSCGSRTSRRTRVRLAVHWVELMGLWANNVTLPSSLSTCDFATVRSRLASS